MDSNEKRLIELTEQGRWLATRVERIENKVDHLIDSHSSLKAKVFTGCVILSFAATLIVEWVRR